MVRERHQPRSATAPSTHALLITKAPELADLIKEAWAKQPDARPTAAELHRRLENVLKKRGGPVTCLKCEDTTSTAV
jgi:hypothetical protein